jgi:hypothetical protein
MSVMRTSAPEPVERASFRGRLVGEAGRISVDIVSFRAGERIA